MGFSAYSRRISGTFETTAPAWRARGFRTHPRLELASRSPWALPYRRRVKARAAGGNWTCARVRAAVGSLARRRCVAAAPWWGWGEACFSPCPGGHFAFKLGLYLLKFQATAPIQSLQKQPSAPRYPSCFKKYAVIFSCDQYDTPKLSSCIVKSLSRKKLPTKYILQLSAIALPL